MGVRGVNLGGWLVYEKWMRSPYLDCVLSEDDHDMLFEFPKDEMEAVLKTHRDSYITEDDFDFMKSYGVDVVRLPFPYHVFGTEHHGPSIEYVDNAMDWASKRGMGVLLDLHTVPMSQNAFDNGGYTGMCRWHMSRRRVEWTLDLLKTVASRYAGHSALWGLQPLNEPANEWQMRTNRWKNGRNHYGRVKVSSAMPLDRLMAFYEMFVDDVAPIVGECVRLVLHDRFELWKWNDFLADGSRNVWIDAHKYVFVKERKFSDMSDFSEYEKACKQYGDEIGRSQAHHPTIVGEWCLGNNYKGADANWYRSFARAQLCAWDRGEGGFFWSYRNDADGFDNWSFRKSVENGWLDFSDGLAQQRLL